jgi:hypothetical protein
VEVKKKTFAFFVAANKIAYGGKSGKGAKRVKWVKWVTWMRKSTFATCVRACGLKHFRNVRNGRKRARAGAGGGECAGGVRGGAGGGGVRAGGAGGGVAGGGE